MVLVDPMHSGASDGLSRDESEPFQVAEGLLHSTQTVPAGHQRVDSPPRERRPGAQHDRKNCPTGAGHHPAERLCKVHTTILTFI